MDYMNAQASKNIQDMQDNTENLENQQINPATNPFSNGTGSGRSVFDPLAQDSINSVNQGQTMGNVMFNKNQQMDPTMQNQGPSLNIVSGGGAGGAGNILTKLGPLAAATAGVVGVGKMIGGMGKKKKEKAKATSGASIKRNNARKVEKEKISGSDFGVGSYTGTKKTITKGDKTIVKTKMKGDDGNWKKKTSEKTVGNEYGDGKVKYVDKSKYSRKASEKNPKKKIKQTKVKEVYKGGEKVKDTYKIKRVDGKNRRKATRKDGEWKAKKK